MTIPTLFREIGVVLRCEWRWFVGLTLAWLVLFAAGPCQRNPGPVAGQDPLPTATAPLSEADLPHPPRLPSASALPQT